MQKVILTIHEKDYLVESYTYSMYKGEGMENNTVSGIPVSLGFSEKNDLDSVMMECPFDCTLTVYDNGGEMIRQITFERAEITSYSESISEQCYISVQINAKAVTFDGRHVTSQPAGMSLPKMSGIRKFIKHNT